MKKVFLLLFSLIVLMSFSSLGFAQKTNPEYVLRLGLNSPIGDPSTVGCEMFADNVYDSSNGRIQIDVYPSAQLGGEREMGEIIQLGTVDMLWGDKAVFGRWVPELDGFTGGYLWQNKEHFYKVMRGPIGEIVNQKLIDTISVRILADGWAGSRHLMTNKPIYKVDDLKGVLLRIPMLEPWVATFKALGAPTTNIAYSEAYMAMKMGQADGLDGPIVSSYAMKFQEVTDYLIFTGHMFATGAISIRNQLFESLPEDLQEILIDEAITAIEYIDEENVRREKEVLPKMKEEMKEFIEVDTEEFREKALNNGMTEWFIDKFGEELYTKIVETK